MKTTSAPVRWLVIAVMMIALSSLSTGQEAFRGKVVGISDGDTISVLREGQSLTIRIHGIDCPEDAQDFSARAKQFTSAKVFGKVVTLEPRDTDRFGRTVARVIVDEEDVGLALVRAGLAWHYRQYSNDPKLIAAERAAREARIGLWSQANPTPPWEYRRPVLLASSEGPFHGNIRSKVFHRPGCRNYDCKNCTRVFAAREEAIAAGYRPAGDCLK